MISIQGKGRAVINTRCFKKNEPMCEYSGELLNDEDGAHRESQYTKINAGSYIYYFAFKGTNLEETLWPCFISNCKKVFSKREKCGRNITK